MPQYYKYKESGCDFRVREGLRDGALVKDQSLTITAFNGIENTDWIEMDEVIHFVPQKPEALTVVALDSTHIDLEWTNIEILGEGVSIERTAVAGGGNGWTEIGTVDIGIEEYHDSGLTAGTTYYYRLKSIIGTAYSEASDVANTFTHHSELVTYTTGLTTPLSTNRKNSINTFIQSLKSGLSITLLSEVFDCMYLLNGETQESALKNLIKDAHHCTAEDSIGFSANNGFIGDGTHGYLDTHYNPNTQGIRHLLNDCSISANLTNVMNSLYDIQISDFANKPFSGICAYTVSPFLFGFLNDGYYDAYSSQEPLKCVGGGGLIIITRNGGSYANMFGYRNKTNITSYPAISNQMPTVSNGNMKLVNFSTRRMSFAFAGKHITTAMRDIIADALTAYISSL